MGGGRNGEGEFPEWGPHDSSAHTHDYRPPPQELEAIPWGGADAYPPPVASERLAADIPTVVTPGGTRVGGTPDQTAWHNEPPQATSPTGTLQSPLPRTESTPLSDNNPFLKKLTHEREASVGSTGVSPPAQPFGQVPLNEPSTNPWGVVASHGTGSSSVYDDGPGRSQDPWSTGPSEPYNTHPVPGQPKTPSVPGGEEELLIWGDGPSDRRQGSDDRGQIASSNQPATEDIWGQDGRSAPKVDLPIRQNETSEEWNLIDHDPRPQQDGPKAPQPPGPAEATSVPNEPTTSSPPPLRSPSGQSGGEQRPALPTRVLGREATEMYQILRIKWYDHKALENPRTSPILVQNANGPCPIVALTNALILSTPTNATDAPLTHALQSREQISIDLLRQTIIEELTASPRRPSDAALPDLTDLYEFLRGLDTGMNANPRFVPSEELPAFMGDWLSNVHPSERDTCIPGGFEQTREMELYSTFSIPLIHGWLPSPSDAVYASMKRRAESYEEAQHILFQEEELQEKLENPTSSGLTPEEQDMYQDILIIKDFLDASATQLTTVGLEVIEKTMPPGSVAILFRNDHFSTLYKHPESHMLLMLVSDSAFAGLEGAVWETVNDVTGKSEFLSGEFQPVGAAQGARDSSSSARLQSGSQNDWSQTGESQRSPNIEQEDQDFAMALQLQEEEDERHRQQQQATRQNNRRLSEQYIDQQGRHPPQAAGRLSLSDPRTGLRRPGASGGTQQVRPLVPPAARGTAARPAVHRPAAGAADEAPPSYDEHANDTPFRPPPGHPNHPTSSPGATSPQLQQSAQSQPQPQPQQPHRPSQGSINTGSGRGSAWNPNIRPVRRPVPVSTSHSKDKDCTVM
ncbi:uncharacterized protein DNG_06007 [Cephalotrichum gorgonifer]|uniref:MINDY deubiquitinase domain-containing protein n=1 Tax=Cephalotrichum gorgonifer TaxID=2041049 RepID=A0AAE8N1T5_9PEZI|nr:uncharacterized protein DNG_06007 [Cephalotrichum gorgonifer]